MTGILGGQVETKHPKATFGCLEMVTRKHSYLKFLCNLYCRSLRPPLEGRVVIGKTQDSIILRTLYCRRLWFIGKQRWKSKRNTVATLWFHRNFTGKKHVLKPHSFAGLRVGTMQRTGKFVDVYCWCTCTQGGIS